jgi:WD40 repeat protein
MALCLVATILPSHAQFYNGSQLTFGKNRVQYNNFQWSYFRFERFDTYFYLNGKELALFTAQYAQEEIKETERKLETSVNDKIQFIIFNTFGELKQSNIGLDDESMYNTGGVTKIIDQKIFLYFDGSHEHLKKQIREGITTIVLNQLLYGSSITSQMKNSTLLFLPDWYLNGLISYLTEDWNTDIDSKVRDGIVSGKYKKFNQLTGLDATYAGHSLWKFVGDKYGETAVSNIIYMAKISKNVESGFLFVLGISFKTVIKEWLNHYGHRYALMETESLPDPASAVLKPKKDVVYSNAKISPDQRFLAYSSNDAGQYKVWLSDLTRKKAKKIFKRGFKLDDKVDYSYPLIAWHPSGKVLSFLTEEKGKINLYFYTVSSRKFDRRFIFNFDKVIDFAYSPDGKTFVMSAVVKGQSDIFVYNIAANSFEQITRDLYDDLEPRFINNGKQIVFTSNRENDSLRPKSEAKFYTPQGDKHEVFLYDYSTKKQVLRRVTTSSHANKRQPMEYEPGFITYLSDENGSYNRYLARFDSAISYIDTITHYRYFTVSYPVTDYCRNIIEQDISSKAGKMAEVIFNENRYRIFVNDLIPAKNQAKIQLQQTEYMKKRIEAETKTKTDSLLTIKKDVTQKRKRFVSVRSDEQDIPADTTRANLKAPGSEKIDINNYVFEKQAFIKLSVQESTDTLQKPAAIVPKAKTPDQLIPKQLNYMVEYTVDNLVSQLDFNFLNSTYQPYSGGGTPIFLNPGFNGFLRVGATDLLEDYRMNGGARLSFNLNNNEYLMSYSNLKGRMDRTFTLHRQIIENSVDDTIFSIVKLQSHEAYYMFSYPFNQVLSARGTFTYRNDRFVYLSIDDTNLRIPNKTKNWAGFKGEIVFDATRSLGLNLYRGTRYKIFGEFWQQVNPENVGLFVVGADFRNYTRIHRTLIWANRFAASTSFGNNRLIYYMGGVDNWLNPKFNNEVPIASDQPYAYQTLATNMRGFTQNIRNGNSFVVLNSEIRLPIFRYFANRPIKSDFINNFQVVGFGDLGTAWNGASPYSKQNSLYRKVIKQGPITVTVENQVEPVVGGYGFGFRTRFLGYFMRVDWSWGVEDLKVRKGIFYFSLSTDF